MPNSADTPPIRPRDPRRGASMPRGDQRILGGAKTDARSQTATGPLLRLASILAVASVLGACSASMGAQPEVATLTQRFSPEVLRRYAALTDEPFPVAAISQTDLKANYVRRVVDYTTREQPGTLIVDPYNRFLYLVMEGGKAMRYGVGVGKAGFEFTGSATVGRKGNWPRWTPTPDMLRREPERNGRWAGGMPGGAGNPLGARAVSLQRRPRYALSHSRNDGAVEYWRGRVVGLHPHAEPRRYRSAPARSGRHASGRTRQERCCCFPTNSNRPKWHYRRVR